MPRFSPESGLSALPRRLAAAVGYGDFAWLIPGGDVSAWRRPQRLGCAATLASRPVSRSRPGTARRSGGCAVRRNSTRDSAIPLRPYTVPCSTPKVIRDIDFPQARLARGGTRIIRIAAGRHALLKDRRRRSERRWPNWRHGTRRALGGVRRAARFDRGRACALFSKTQTSHRGQLARGVPNCCAARACEGIAKFDTDHAPGNC